VQYYYSSGAIDNWGIYISLLAKLQGALKALSKGQTDVAINKLTAFINEVQAQSGNHITAEAAAILIADARWVIYQLMINPTSVVFFQMPNTPTVLYLPSMTK
jgi:hypothetical protein